MSASWNEHEAGEAGSKPISQTEIRIISAWGLLLAACPLHRWLRVCLVPAVLRVSVWCQLGTDARGSLCLALNGRMLRAHYKVTVCTVSLRFALVLSTERPCVTLVLPAERPCAPPRASDLPCVTDRAYM